MSALARRLTLAEWDTRYAALRAGGLREPWYGGPLSRHAHQGDARLKALRFDESPEALRLWNFVLSEEDRLAEYQAAGKRLVGAMKDLGTVPVLAFSLPNLVAFYPDGAWWTPCLMEYGDGLLQAAGRWGIDDSFCPVRAMLGAFVLGNRFPLPELLIASVGATCDDLAAIAQRLEDLGHTILWWEIPHRRVPEPDEPAVELPGGFAAAASQVAAVRAELARVAEALARYAGQALTEDVLREGIRRANGVRSLLDRLRTTVFTAPACPLPALEMLAAEMLAIHFCSDPAEAAAVLEGLLAEACRRVARGIGVLPPEAARVFWVNPVADLRAMNLLEEAGGRICGTEYLFAHALDTIPEDLEPLEALARMALADPMVGSPADRAARILRDAARFGAEAVVISRIPGASHCGLEGTLLAREIRRATDLPVVELEVPPVLDPLEPTLVTRLEALVETAKCRPRRTPRSPA